jgi:aspartate aminotransferase
MRYDMRTIPPNGSKAARGLVVHGTTVRRRWSAIVVVSDEPYRTLVFDDVAVPEVPPLVTRGVVATSWSKSLAISGERIGYLAFSPRMPEAAELFEACTFTSRVLGFVNAPALCQWLLEPGELPGPRKAICG